MRRTFLTMAIILGFAMALGAQTKAPATPSDYGQWETLVTIRDTGGLSPDGKWLAYGINRSNRNNELRITNAGPLRRSPLKPSLPQPPRRPNRIP